MEPPETANVTKIVPDDEGLLFMEDGYVCLNTLCHFYRVQPANFSFEPMQLSKREPGMLFRFVPEGGSSEVKLAVTFIYYGSNLKVAADPEAVRCGRQAFWPDCGSGDQSQWAPAGAGMAGALRTFAGCDFGLRCKKGTRIAQIDTNVSRSRLPKAQNTRSDAPASTSLKVP
jgi:hypothetical protein